MVAAPSGTITFLFSDIEGSTRVLAELGDWYVDVLLEHRRQLRDAFGRHGGFEVDTEGDSFFVAFASRADAKATKNESPSVSTSKPPRCVRASRRFRGGYRGRLVLCCYRVRARCGRCGR